MKRLMIFFLVMAWAAVSAAGQVSSKTAELGWLELPAFSEDPEHFFVFHYTDEYWGKQRNYSLFWDQKRQIPLWVAYPLNGGLWAWLEEYVQQLAISAGEGWVITGCIDSDASNWVTDVAGRPIAVPEGFFKAVLLKLPSEGGKGPFFEARAWVVENRSYGFSGFEGKADEARVSIDELEELLQCDLFPNLLSKVGPQEAAVIEAQIK